MAGRTLHLSELRGLSEAAREERIQKFSAPQPPNGELEHLQQKIAELENRYEMSSAQMREKLESGELRETAEIGSWIMLLSIRESFGITTAP